MKGKRPWGITLASVVLAIGGALSLLSVILTFLFSMTILSVMPDYASYVAGAYLLTTFISVILAIAYIAVAYFLWNKKTWAWWVAIILAVIGLLMGLPSLIAMNVLSILMLLLDVVIIIGLAQKDARKAYDVKI